MGRARIEPTMQVGEVRNGDDPTPLSPAELRVAELEGHLVALYEMLELPAHALSVNRGQVRAAMEEAARIKGVHS